MKEQLRKAINACKLCQEDRPAQARPTLNGLLQSALLQPMLHLATDVFDLDGNTYIVLFNQYSGYAWTDTRSVWESLTCWFTEFGWPSYIRTDGGPQFRDL